MSVKLYFRVKSYPCTFIPVIFRIFQASWTTPNEQLSSTTDTVNMGIGLPFNLSLAFDNYFHSQQEAWNFLETIKEFDRLETGNWYMIMPVFNAGDKGK